MTDEEKNTRRVIVLAPMPPEKAAYALARYSRSPDSIEDSLRWVHGHSSEKFWEQFYFAYGHASIADLGHVTVCLEGISELAAIRLEDEPLWDGQAKSSRYQNFAVSGCYVPSTIRDSEPEAFYRGILGSLFNLYRTFHDPLLEHLQQRYPRPDGMSEANYGRTLAARVYDITRYLLPLASTTNVGEVVSIRTLEKQITRFLSTQLPELQALGEELQEACAKPPSNVWGELDGESDKPAEPLAPTLARHAKANEYQTEVYRDLSRHAKKIFRKAGLDEPSAWTDQTVPVDLIEPHSLMDELVTSVLYRVSQAPYRRILELVREWPEKEKQETLEVALRHRGPYDELIKEFRCGYPLIFDVLMDIGGWRDLHRHRRCQQIQQNFTTVHGYEIPAPLYEANLDREYQMAMDAVQQDIERLRGMDQEASIYAIPFGFRVRCVFKMDYAQA
ncbi:MAG: FAD-dependent thymidylate synthase, partial [Nitrospira sp. SB0678_bin_10]|nr:FAD-dependent thymidylate synthase [Nitrospira sp. SB0678_bin_10]